MDMIQVFKIRNKMQVGCRQSIYLDQLGHKCQPKYTIKSVNMNFKIATEVSFKLFC